MRAHLDLTSNVTDFDVDETFAHILPDHVLLNHVRAEAIVSLSRMFTHLHFETSTRSRQQSGERERAYLSTPKASVGKDTFLLGSRCR
jgi:hypothetical protein